MFSTFKKLIHCLNKPRYTIKKMSITLSENSAFSPYKKKI